MNIIIVSDEGSWINAYLPELIVAFESRGCRVGWQHSVKEIPPGDLVFFLGCGQLVPPEVLARNKHNLVVHESALPKGRGWSPLTWQILAGQNVIPICLFEAEAMVDSGRIYLQDRMVFQGHELVDELRAVQAAVSIRMCLAFVDRYPGIVELGTAQEGEPTYYPRRKPEDSRLDPDKTLREQFNLLRVADNDRYPAFFEINGTVYRLRVEKAGSMQKE